MNKPESEQAKNWAYYTPPEVVVWAHWVASPFLGGDTNCSVFDPACGDGRLTANFRNAHGFDITYNSKADESLDFFEVVGDSLEHVWPACGVVLMNPPFGSRSNDLAGKFIVKALGHMRSGKCSAVVAIARTSLLQTKSRECIPMPSRRFDMSWRPHFEVDGSALNGGHFQDFSIYLWLPCDVAHSEPNVTMVSRITKDGRFV